MCRHIISVVMAIGFLMLACDAATPSSEEAVHPSISETPSASGPSRSTMPSAELYNTCNSEVMMDYFEALPKRTIKQLLDDDELTDFVSDYEKQIFDQETVFVSHSDFRILSDAVEKVLTPSEMTGLLTLFTFNVSVASDSLPDDDVVGTEIDSSSDNSTKKPEYPDYDICPDSFEESSLIYTNYSHLPPVKTIVRMEHVITHPMIQMYANKLGLARILKQPNLLQQFRNKKKKFLNVVFLDMSLLSLLESKITCYKLLKDDSMMVRFGVAFGKTLNAMELSAIPSYLNHVSDFTTRALKKSSVIVELKDRNYTSPAIEVDSENQNPCLFFNLLGSCENGGICVGFTGVGNCRCPKGFEGKFCHSKVKELTIKKSDSVVHRWMNFVYMLVGVVILSATIILFSNFLKSRRSKDKSASDATGGQVVAFSTDVAGSMTAGNDGGGGAVTTAGNAEDDRVSPYQLPKIAVTANSSSRGSKRRLGIRTRGDRGCGASYSVKKKHDASTDGSMTVR